MPNEIRIPRIAKTLDDCPVALRDYFDKKDDGFHLRIEGDDPRLEEFRANNRSLNGKVTELEERLKAFDNLDAVQARAAIARVAELEAQVGQVPETASKLTAAEQALAAERDAHAATKLGATISATFLALGGERAASDFVVAKAREIFSIDPAGKVVATKLAADGTPLSVESWLQDPALKFCYKPSRGAGTNPISHTTQPAASGASRISAGDAEAFGRNLEGIAAGRVHVV
jgi:hypothetical protein